MTIYLLKWQFTNLALYCAFVILLNNILLRHLDCLDEFFDFWNNLSYHLLESGLFVLLILNQEVSFNGTTSMLTVTNDIICYS